METRFKKIDFVEERSPQAKEVLGKAPIWVVRWGITAVFFVVASLVFLSWIVKYPDIVAGRITITTPQPPISVKARADGRIANLFVEDKQMVKPGDLLGVIENPAELEDVLWLKRKIAKFNATDPVSLTGSDSIITQTGLILGPLQGSYSTFLKRCQEFLLNNQLQAIDKELLLIEAQILEYEALRDKQENRKSILSEEKILVDRAFDRREALLKIGAVSKDEIERTEREKLEVRKDLELAETNIAQTTIDISNLRKKMIELEILQEENHKKLYIDLFESFKNLSAAISGWEQRYLLRSQIHGKVSFFNYWSKEQFVRSGDEVFSIIPDESQSIVGKMVLTIQNSGKVKSGQKVNVSLDGYPYQEYGMILGKVTSISLIPRNELYAVEVALPEKLKTSYGKEIEFRQELQGTGEIVTEDIRFLQRIFYQLRKISKTG